MNVFYLPDAQEGSVVLPEEESKHCVRVLRMEVGDGFLVSDGKGFIYDATLEIPNPKKAVVNLSNKRNGYDHWPFRLEIAVAPTKLNERIEWFVEKATEIGIDKIHFFTSFHSERRAINVERFRKIAVSALKQSMKSRLPEIDDIVSLEKLVKMPFNGDKYIAWIDDDVKDNLCDVYKKGSDALILIGPEGDFSLEEANLAITNGFKPVSLGNARLRTETAALAACFTVQLKNQIQPSALRL